ncbi:MAG: hypothetical protein ACK56F_14045, partial [bacterium]
RNVTGVNRPQRTPGRTRHVTARCHRLVIGRGAGDVYRSRRLGHSPWEANKNSPSVGRGCSETSYGRVGRLPLLHRVAHVEQDLEIQLLATIREVERGHLGRVTRLLGAVKGLAVHLFQV